MIDKKLASSLKWRLQTRHRESELLSLFQTGDFDSAMRRMRTMATTAFVTRSEKGSVCAHGDDTWTVPAHPCAIIDTAGAGDQYAAGVLYGLTHGRTHAECARLGSLAASEVISHYGPAAAGQPARTGGTLRLITARS